MGSPEMTQYLKDNNIQDKTDQITHIVWTTGGSLVPENIREEYKNTYLIGVTRFELATSASRTQRSTKLSHTPLNEL